MTERTLPRRLMQSETLGDGVAVFPGNFESDPLYGHIRHSDPGHPLGIDQPSTVDAYEPIVQQTLPLRNPGSRRIEPVSYTHLVEVPSGK